MPEILNRDSYDNAGHREAGGRGLLVVDDWFPNLMTGFRVAEFVHYLRVFPKLRVASTVPSFDGVCARFALRYPDLAGRVLPWSPDLLEKASAAWFVFLNNAHRWVADVERHAIPFAFTLYPGGGFNLADRESEAKLARVLTSPMLRAVIATQPIVTEFLRRMHCNAPVYKIPGVVVNPAYIIGSRARTVARIPQAIGICFAAFRYDAGGRGKGFPEFLKAAAILASCHPGARFAVAGDLGPQDWPLPPSLRGRITFRGPLPTAELRQFFLAQDIIISPTRRHAISGTEFDGFPTGSCVEAALCGVAIVSSDELNQNRSYRHGEEILVCPPDSEAIVATIDPYLRDTTRLTALAEAGRRRTVELYGVTAQLIRRTQILRTLAAERDTNQDAASVMTPISRATSGSRGCEVAAGRSVNRALGG